MSGNLRFSTSLAMIFGAMVTVAVGCGGSDASGGPAPAAGAGGTGGSSMSGGTGGTTSSGGSGGDAGEVGSGGSTTSGGSGGKSASGGTGGSSGTGGAKGGTGGSGTGGSGAATADLLDEIEGHCERDCDAQYALDCAPANSNSLVCQLSCAASTAQLGDFCLREYADVVQCRADGGYACLSETQPYPNSTCAVQTQAFGECTQHLGCKRQCAVAIAEGCTTAPFDTCLQACIDETTSLPERCSYYNESIATCRVTAGNPVCDGESLATPATCAYYVTEIGGCITDESGDYCEGWCYAADELGCGGDDCMADCQAKVDDPTCGSAWTNVIDCGMRSGNAECTDGTFTATSSSCDYYLETHATCLAGDAGT